MGFEVRVSVSEPCGLHLPTKPNFNWLLIETFKRSELLEWLAGVEEVG